MRFGACFENVEGTGEEERELQGCAEGSVAWGGWEDGDVERVVLGERQLEGRRRGLEERDEDTFLPITPRQAIEGIVVIAFRGCWCVRGGCKKASRAGYKFGTRLPSTNFEIKQIGRYASNTSQLAIC